MVCAQRSAPVRTQLRWQRTRTAAGTFVGDPDGSVITYVVRTRHDVRPATCTWKATTKLVVRTVSTTTPTTSPQRSDDCHDS